jgi:hypothetical protein
MDSEFKVARAGDVDSSDPAPNETIVVRDGKYICTVHGHGLCEDAEESAAIIASLLNRFMGGEG